MHSNKSMIVPRSRRQVLAGLLAVAGTAVAAGPVLAAEAVKKDKEKKGFDTRKLFQGLGTILRASQGLDYESEKTIGESLALEGFKRYGMPVEDEHVQRFVNLLGVSLARDSMRPDIPYRFVVVKNDVKNAFSCPGGIIFLSSGLFTSLKTEAQLACVLAHEVAHVAHKDAIKSIQQAQFLKGVGTITSSAMEGDKGRQFQAMIGDLQTTLFDTGLSYKMEYAADLGGMDTAYRTGYGPNGMIETLQILRSEEKGAIMKGSWYSTHPPLAKRIANCQAHLRDFSDYRQMRQHTGRLQWYQKRV